MKSLALLAVIAAAASSTLAVPAPPSPMQMVEQFVKMDVEGLRLTPQGWHKADALFSRPGNPSQPKVLIVIGRHYAVSRAARGNMEEFYVGYEEVGRIDASLHFEPTIAAVETRSFEKYTVVLMSARPLETGGETKIEAGARHEWRIDGGQPAEMHLTAVTAMRYVSRMRAETANPILKKNAEQTIAKLRQYK